MDSPTVITSLAALAQESRLAIFRLLVEVGPTGLAVGEIGASLRVSPARAYSPRVRMADTSITPRTTSA